MRKNKWNSSKKKVVINSLILFNPFPLFPHLASIEKERNFDEDDDNDIMSHLNYRKLEEIKKDFLKTENEALTIEQFIKVMLHHLPETKDRVGLVRNLVELFR